jgi:predicted CXXCH cytochrome family protein
LEINFLGIGDVAMPKHIIRLLLILAGLLALGLIAKSLLTDPSFYKYGHYRADVVVELAEDVPQIRGPDYCKACHGERHKEWDEGGHNAVKCEVCHGAARQHPANGKLPLPEDTIKLCTVCHEALAARPESHPQIVVQEHPYPHDAPVQCKVCHDPHAPKIGGAVKAADSDPAASVAPAATSEEAQSMPLRINQCIGCHGDNGQGVGPFPALAAIDAGHFIEQMNNYKTGERTDAVMNGIAQALSDEEIKELAEYYASLPG